MFDGTMIDKRFSAQSVAGAIQALCGPEQSVITEANNHLMCWYATRTPEFVAFELIASSPIPQVQCFCALILGKHAKLSWLSFEAEFRNAIRTFLMTEIWKLEPHSNLLRACPHSRHHGNVQSARYGKTSSIRC
jgi:hypothetical protein